MLGISKGKKTLQKIQGIFDSKKLMEGNIEKNLEKTSKV